MYIMILSKIIKPRMPLKWITLCKVTHTSTCPTKWQNEKKTPCTNIAGGSRTPKLLLKRAEFSGKCRLGFIPEEWFLFFHPITGVSGPYVFGLVLINYLLSKEIYVLEHEYYLGLSIFIMIVYANKKFSSPIAKALDKQVDEKVAEMEKSRKDEMTSCEKSVKDGQDAQWRAKGQELLIAAKKENVLMQQEAIYRERALMVYKAVKGRIDYHVKKHQAESRIHQKWMQFWIMDQVMKSITPDFEKQALDKAISDLAAVAGRVK